MVIIAWVVIEAFASISVVFMFANSAKGVLTDFMMNLLHVWEFAKFWRQCLKLPILAFRKSFPNF